MNLKISIFSFLPHILTISHMLATLQLTVYDTDTYFAITSSSFAKWKWILLRKTIYLSEIKLTHKKNSEQVFRTMK